MFKHLSHTTLIGVAVVLLGMTGTAAAVAGHTTSAAMPACRVSDLSARLVPGSPGAGQRYATLELTNRSRHTCHTYGYVGMLLLSSHGRALATDVVRDHTTRPHRVVLAPGHWASARLHWTVVQGVGDGSGPCVTPPRRVEITPPDEFSHLIIGWSGGVVCQRGRINVTPLVYAG
jgi:hypothetical protein